MRIRNVKPEFYRSDDIDALTWEQRFFFIALFTYVDDNGVGRDREVDICADLFAGDFSVDPGETLGRVRQALLALHKGGLLARYEVESKRYLFITGWDNHQYVKNPNRERYPRPDKALLQASVDAGETLGNESGDAEQHLPPVVGSRSLVVGSESWVEDTCSNADAFERLFAAFWSLYPRRVAKAAAQKAFKAALKKVDAQAIADALDASSAAWTASRTPADKIPYPATWLNREPWHDDPDAIAPTPQPPISRRQQETDEWFARSMQRAQDADAAAERTSDRKAIA